MKSKLTRRNLLVAGAGAASMGSALWPHIALAQTGAAIRPLLTVRAVQDFDLIDPAHRRGPVDGNVMRVVYQRLMQPKPNSSEIELDAAAEIKQTSPTTIEFRLKPRSPRTRPIGCI